MNEAAESEIRGAFDRGDLDKAATVALKHYGEEVYSLLCARLRSESDAHDVFGQLNEDLWKGLPGFRWQCSFRTWFYTLARHAALRFENLVANQPARRRGPSALLEMEAPERSRTHPYLRTSMKDRFSALRASLSPDEQTILVLRIDRNLSWEEVARVMQDDADADVKQASSNLRQRFAQLKKRLHEQARVEGLLEETSSFQRK